MSSIREILNVFVKTQGWNDETVITILCNYISKPNGDGDPDVLAFRDFLQEQAALKKKNS